MPTNRLLEASPYDVDDGNLIGRDPRKLKMTDILEAGIDLRVPTKAIRQACLQCCGYQEAEVRKCVATTCPLWCMRMGNLSRELRKAIKAKELAEKDEGDETNQ